MLPDEQYGGSGSPGAGSPTTKRLDRPTNLWRQAFWGHEETFVRRDIRSHYVPFSVIAEMQMASGQGIKKYGGMFCSKLAVSAHQCGWRGATTNIL